MTNFVRELERMIQGCTIEWNDAQKMHDLITVCTRPMRMPGVDDNSVQSGHYATYGGQVRGEGPQMKEPNYYGPPSSKGKPDAH